MVFNGIQWIESMYAKWGAISRTGFLLLGRNKRKEGRAAYS